jgi:hypothetical protein
VWRQCFGDLAAAKNGSNLNDQILDVQARANPGKKLFSQFSATGLFSTVAKDGWYPGFDA